MTFFFSRQRGDLFLGASAGTGSSSCGIVSHRLLVTGPCLRIDVLGGGGRRRRWQDAQPSRCRWNEYIYRAENKSREQDRRSVCSGTMGPPSRRRRFGVYHEQPVARHQHLQLMGSVSRARGLQHLNLPHRQEPQRAHLGDGPLPASLFLIHGCQIGSAWWDTRSCSGVR
ncbi:hypothetical protein GGI42DRAFT_310326 [Trichoderma sp. SZMC 28013]